MFSKVAFGTVLCLLHCCVSKIHHITFQDDKRLFIQLLDFGFLSGGTLDVQISNFSTLFEKFVLAKSIGFTLSRGDEVNELLKASSECILRQPESISDVVYLSFDISKKEFVIDRVGNDKSFEQLMFCTPVLQDLLSPGKNCYDIKGNVQSVADIPKNVSGQNDNTEIENVSQIKGAPLHSIVLVPDEAGMSFSAEFEVKFARKSDEGQYWLIFHNCLNYAYGIRDQLGISFAISITARNLNSYLSAGELINPSLYFGLAILFLFTCLFWVHILRTTRDSVYKIHYLMATLVFLKSLSLLFHGINYYFISLYGQQRAVWAIVYYLMHLLKGLLLFGVIILIGTGWTFFKNFLTNRDRKLFMIVIPLQIFDNIALIIKEESEIGLKSYSFWLKLFILVDLICCAAIILPVIWSIRHLQEASMTDGKAAFNLRKLKLFRHFYIIIICYIYLTRIVNYLVVFTVPFKYSYMVVVVVELGSWFFYVLTGYKFKPAINNPYLKLAVSEEDEADAEDILLQSGALENVVRVNRATYLEKQQFVSQKNRDGIEMEQAFIDKELSHELD